MTEESDLEARVEELEAIVERQEELLAERSALESNAADSRDETGGDGDGRDGGTADVETSVSRRTALKTLGAVGLLGAGVATTAGTAAASPQGRVGTEDRPLAALYAETIRGGHSGSPLSIEVDGDRALELGLPSEDGDGGNVVAGHPDNDADGTVGATISGGGRENQENVVTADYGSIGGGRNNDALGEYATVGGGIGNAVEADRATIGGGSFNDAFGEYATVGGGWANVAGSDDGSTAWYPTVAGGNDNAATHTQASVGGGRWNEATALAATVGGGNSNVASGEFSFVGGGRFNEATANGATVGGGNTNVASGWRAMVPGGSNNEAAGSYSFAAGNRAKADHNGCFVWADDTFSDVASTDRHQFVVRSSGGVWFGDDSSPDLSDGLINTSTGAYLSDGGSWTNASSVASKTNFGAVDPVDVLDRVADIEISTWEYENEDDQVRHMGPVAETFYDAFGLGVDERSIATVDADGVAFAAIQGLVEELEKRDERVADLESRLEALEADAGTEIETPAGGTSTNERQAAATSTNGNSTTGN